MKLLFLYEPLPWYLHTKHWECVYYTILFRDVYTRNANMTYKNLWRGVYTVNAWMKLLFLFEPLPWYLHAKHWDCVYYTILFRDVYTRNANMTYKNLWRGAYTANAWMKLLFL